MKVFLFVALGVIVGGLAFLAFLYFFLKAKLGGLGQAFKALGEAWGAVPPFRVSLRTLEGEGDWNDRDGVAEATSHFEAAGFGRLGDFEITEIDGVTLRAFHHAGHRVFAAITEHPEKGVFADVVRGFTDGQLTVTTTPESGLARPESSPMIHVATKPRDPGTPERLEARMLEASAGREPTPWERGDFEEVFVNAYTEEMNWHISRGGVTEGELRAVAAASGKRADEVAVEIVMEAWKQSIRDFIDDETFEALEKLFSPEEWESIRGRIYVVHEHTDVDERMDELAWETVEETLRDASESDEDEAVEKLAAELKSTFEDVSTRDGFTRVQARLPEKQRLELVTSLEKPWPADVYVAPVAGDEA